MKLPIRYFYFCVNLTIWVGPKLLWAQLPDTISLQMVIEMAVHTSLSTLRAESDKDAALFNYEIYNAGLKPQFTLQGTLPNFTRSSNPVVQPDGGIQFQPIRYDNSNLNLKVSQLIPQTGGLLSFQSDFQRFKDGENDFKQFNAIPFRLGINQPLFAYNPFKWDKKIEPIKQLEARNQFNADLESIRALVLGAYFDVLISDKIHQSAVFNLKNATELQRISAEKFKLGRLSRNDLLQLELNERNAINILSQSERLLVSATTTLYDIMGFRFEGKISFPQLPEPLRITLNRKTILNQSRGHLPEIIALNRILLERQRALDQARRDNGFRLDLFAAFGLFRSSAEAGALFSHLNQDQVFSVGIKLPIFDWGIRKSKIAIAKTDLAYHQASMQVRQMQLESGLTRDLINFEKLAAELKSTEEINEIARERFEIARQSFILGSISVTELFISQREQDDAIRAYINTLSVYWNTYYQIRSQTLYDFEQEKSLVN